MISSDELETLSLITPEKLQRWHQTLFYSAIERSTFDFCEHVSGRRDLAFVLEANRRAIRTMIELYDLACNEDERKRMRASFRLLMSRRKGRLAPWWDELHFGIRVRLREHREYVRWGLDPPDEPRKRRRANG
jgi:hypothetical protein